LTLASLTAANGADEDRDLLKYVSNDPESWPSRLVERSELQRVLAEGIEKLPPVEKTVLNLYYSEELTLREISRIVDLHESRISQLKTQATVRLRAYMHQEWPTPRGM
jgi:RNA polymerase sigma factor for flagellar operon FliA